MPIKIFFCYAREDEALLNKLKIQLRPLLRQGIVDTWHDRDIEVGTEWEREISQHLNTAQIILLLISPDFMNSDYCYGVEMKRALERHKQGNAHVVPIILRPVHWQEEPLQTLQALPTDAKPVKSWPDLDEALFNVADGIRKVIKEQWLKKSNGYHSTQFYGEALQAITQALRLDSRDPQLHKIKGNVLYKLKRSEDALEAFEQSIQLEPNDASVYSSKATLLNEFGQYRDALLASEHAIELDVNYAPAYYVKGQALQKLACYQDALAAYERVIQINPDHVKAYEGKGQMLSQLRQNEEALVVYQQATRLQPDSADLWSAQGIILHKLYHNQEALTAFETAITLKPNNASLYREKAIVLQDLHRVNDAHQAYKKARQLGEGSSLIELTVECIKIRNRSCGLVILKEKIQSRRLSIEITDEEAFVIANNISTSSFEQMPRLYNLVKNIITSLGASITKVVISELIEDTFYGNIVLRIIDKQVEIDAHIADIIALAIYAKAPIFIEEDVFERTRDISYQIHNFESDLREEIQVLNSLLSTKGVSIDKSIVSEKTEISIISTSANRGRPDMLTRSAKRVLRGSESVAIYSLSNHVDPEHILSSLVQEEDSIAAQIISQLEIHPSRVLDSIERVTHSVDTVDVNRFNREIVLTQRSKRLLLNAISTAHQMNHRYIGTHHFLLSFLMDEKELVALILDKLGIKYGNVYTQATQILNQIDTRTN